MGSGVRKLELIIVLLIAVLGASLGSFFNVLIDRLPRKASIIKPPSSCSDCGYRIPVWLNIPIFSYIFLRGRCSKCGAFIHWHHLVVEIITPLLFIALFYKFGLTSILFFKYLVLISFLIPIFFIDALHQLILHVTSIPLIVIGLIFALLPGSDVPIANALATSAFIFCFLLLLAWAFSKIRNKDGLGGGDIWLLTGISTFFGFAGIPLILIFACVFAILYYIVVIRQKERPFVFGPFIVIATLIWIFLSEFILGKWLG